MQVFTYGSLMFPEVWRRVTGGGHAAQAALLDGHARRAIRGESYPGIVVCPGESVQGILYRDVEPAALAALDAFEGPEYRRETVRVRLQDGGHGGEDELPAAAYLYLVPEKLSDRPWRPEDFDPAGFIGAHCR